MTDKTREWIIVHEPGRVLEKKVPGAAADGTTNGMLRELIACRPSGTRYTVVTAAYGGDIYVQDGHERLAEHEALDSLTPEDWAAISDLSEDAS